MKKFLLFFPFILFGNDITLKQLITHYKQKDYRYVCLQGYKVFKALQKDEDLLSMYAFACLRSDYVDRLAVPILILGKTKESRKNRAYFSLILTQKNILISALADNERFANLQVPNSDHIISKIFNLFFQKKYKKVDNVYEMSDADGSYRLYLQYKKRRPYLVIEEVRQGRKILHIYR